MATNQESPTNAMTAMPWIDKWGTPIFKDAAGNYFADVCKAKPEYVAQYGNVDGNGYALLDKSAEVYENDSSNPAEGSPVLKRVNRGAYQTGEESSLSRKRSDKRSSPGDKGKKGKNAKCDIV